jgi:hypothetical protein
MGTPRSGGGGGGGRDARPARAAARGVWGGGPPPPRRYAEKIEDGLGRSRLTFHPSAFILQHFLDAPIKGSLAQFLYINWPPARREQALPSAGCFMPQANRRCERRH